MGFRCQICTGCGLCPGVRTASLGSKLQVITEDLAGEPLVNLSNERGYRLAAVDVGTTTIAMELYGGDGGVEDRFVTLNSQAEYGADVLSRITAAQDPLVRMKLKDMVKSALVRGAERFLKCLKPGEKLAMVIAANTTMGYLLMGWDPAELGRAPFAASHLDGGTFWLDTGALAESPVPCLLLPGISAFVGGDVLAGICASGFRIGEKMQLLVDLGTNGEIALGNQDGLLVTATAAGPAFEGGASRGIWGADVVRFAARLREEGILDETGLMAEPYFGTGIRIGNVLITQEAVRGLQVAKAAILAGIQILTEAGGISLGEIDRVILAGGFGYYLNPEDAVKIGLLPESLGGRTYAGGNTALSGAKRIGARLLRTDFWEENAFGREKVLPEEERRYFQRAKALNLAAQDHFQERYVAAMSLKKLS